jgi:tetratricopeptide (TPR) repeat protein
MVALLPDGFGALLEDATLRHIRSAIQPSAASGARRWHVWARDLYFKLARYEEAESAYREAIARDPGLPWSWRDLGNLLQDELHRYAEAETCYREAIARDPKQALGWSDLARLLHDHLERYPEAEKAYREAIALDPTDAQLWTSLGELLHHDLQRYKEAEAAYGEAIARDPESPWPWIGLGDLRREHFQRYAEAAAAYCKGIVRLPKSASPSLWNSLGNVYCDYLNRLPDAAEAYANALRLDPTDDLAHQNRLFLRRDFMGEGRDARPLMVELQKLPKQDFGDTTHLHEALFAAYDSNWGLACEALARALAIRAAGFRHSNTDDWLRASAVLLHLNYGAELLAFLDQRGDTARLRPWVEALRAHHIGDRRALQNVAPEIRIAAEIFYDGIESRLKRLPDKTRRRPLAEPKRTRSRRS